MKGSKRKEKKRSPRVRSPRICRRRDYSRLETLLKRRLVEGVYPSGSRSRSDVSPAHTVRDRSVLLSPPDGFRLGKHTNVANSLAGRACRLPRDIHHRIIARLCPRAVRTCSFCLCLLSIKPPKRACASGRVLHVRLCLAACLYADTPIHRRRH